MISVHKICFVMTLSLSIPVSGAEDLSEFKPSPSDPNSAEKMLRLSDSAARRGVVTLVIAFEGLNCFSETGTLAAYRYHSEISQQQIALAPGVDAGESVVSGLLLPAISEFKGSFEFLVFPFKDTATARICALTWLDVEGRRLIVIGHSYGAAAAVTLAKSLEEKSKVIDEVITIDPRAILLQPKKSIHATRNVRRWVNYYQYGGGLSGQSMKDAHVNIRLKARHLEMPRQPEVQQSFFASLRQ